MLTKEDELVHLGKGGSSDTLGPSCIGLSRQNQTFEWGLETSSNHYNTGAVVGLNQN